MRSDEERRRFDQNLRYQTGRMTPDEMKEWERWTREQRELRKHPSPVAWSWFDYTTWVVLAIIAIVLVLVIMGWGPDESCGAACSARTP